MSVSKISPGLVVAPPKAPSTTSGSSVAIAAAVFATGISIFGYSFSSIKNAVGAACAAYVISEVAQAIIAPPAPKGEDAAVLAQYTKLLEDKKILNDDCSRILSYSRLEQVVSNLEKECIGFTGSDQKELIVKQKVLKKLYELCLKSTTYCNIASAHGDKKLVPEKRAQMQAYLKMDLDQVIFSDKVTANIELMIATLNSDAGASQDAVDFRFEMLEKTVTKDQINMYLLLKGGLANYEQKLAALNARQALKANNMKTVTRDMLENKITRPVSQSIPTICEYLVVCPATDDETSAKLNRNKEDPDYRKCDKDCFYYTSKPSNKVENLGICHTQGRRNDMEDADVHFAVNVQDRHGKMHKVSVLGVFDGHGGDQAAKYLEANFQKQFMDTLKDLAPRLDLNEKTIIPTVLKKTISTLEDKFRSQKHEGAGSTVNVVAVIDGEHVFIANAGDARSLMVGPSKFQQLSIDDDPKEKEAQISSLGGFVNKTDGRIGNVLAVANPFGDFNVPGADLEITLSYSKVSDVAEVGEDVYIIDGCDGLYDVMESGVVACLVKQLALEGKSPEEMAKTLTREAWRRGSGDNISVMVHKVKKAK